MLRVDQLQQTRPELHQHRRDEALLRLQADANAGIGPLGYRTRAGGLNVFTGQSQARTIGKINNPRSAPWPIKR